MSRLNRKILTDRGRKKFVGGQKSNRGPELESGQEVSRGQGVGSGQEVSRGQEFGSGQEVSREQEFGSGQKSAGEQKDIGGQESERTQRNGNGRIRRVGQSRKDEYGTLQTKVFIWTILLMFVAVLAIWGLYAFLLQGHFANTVVKFLELFVYHDYDRSLRVYQRVFRNNITLFFLLGVLFIFFVIMRIYLKNFTRYFNEINGAIDALVWENAEDVTLSAELAATEKKINHIIHSLEQRKLAAEFAEQRKNDLVVYLAHDLKTPLTSVIGYLTLLHDESQISEELREKYLSIALDKAERLEELINEFFEITRFNLSNITLEYSRVNLTRLLEQLAFEFRPMLLEKNLTCTLEADPDILIKCDVDKMQRVFDNLLRNAVNYSFENEEITIRVEQDGRDVHITFSNHGNTIPPDKLERIFEQFYRLDSSRGSAKGGAGLGLAIAKKIVELHNGSITARSENEVIEFEVVI